MKIPRFKKDDATYDNIKSYLDSFDIDTLRRLANTLGIISVSGETLLSREYIYGVILNTREFYNIINRIR